MVVWSALGTRVGVVEPDGSALSEAVVNELDRIDRGLFAADRDAARSRTLVVEGLRRCA